MADELECAIDEYRRRKQTEAAKKYYQTHREHCLAYRREWRRTHKEYMREYMRKYRKRQKELEKKE